MARPDDSALRFPCPRCFGRLRAPTSQGGTQRRCPVCQLVFKVPTESRGLKPREGYAVHEIADRLPAADPTTISITCPVCAGRMYAAEDQVGQEVTCPDCETPVVVPSRDDVREAAGQGKVTVVPSEGYALGEEVNGDESQRSRRAADATYIPVTCHVCNTLMKVTEDQVGHEVVCPDCELPIVVPPLPAVKRRPDPRDATVGEYDIQGETGAPPSQRQTLIPVVCILCGTRLHATADQAGQEIACPDCDRLIVVPPPPPPRRKPNTPAEDTEKYEVGEAVESPEYEATITGNRRRLLREEAEAEVAALLKPPRWPFLSGVFNFPVYRRSWPRWVGLSLGGAFVLVLLIGAMGAIAHRDFVSWVTALVFFASACVLAMIWLVYASVTLLSVLVDTAYGYDEIQNWPEGPYVDWMMDAFFVINALLLSAAPVAGPAFVMGSAALLSGPYLPISVLVLFPIILLSMLDANSCAAPFSLTTGRTLIHAWRAWGLFYLETTPLVVASAWLTWLLLEWMPTTLIAPFLAMAAAMIYFRLLGRLAYCCSKATAESEQQNDDALPDDA